MYHSFALHYVQDKAVLFRAAESGDVATVRRLLDAHVNINSTNEVYIIMKHVSHKCMQVAYVYIFMGTAVMMGIFTPLAAFT